jgi:hypothetical protein
MAIYDVDDDAMDNGSGPDHFVEEHRQRHVVRLR